MTSPEYLAGRVDQLKALAKARTATGFTGAAPGWLTDPTDEDDDAAAALARLIEAVPDPLYRRAARDLFPLPYDSPPGSLSERRIDAAQHFGVSASTFRTGTSTRPSYEDQVLGAIVAVIDPPNPPVSRRRVAPLVVAALGVSLLAATIAVIAWTDRFGSPPAEARSSTGEVPDASPPAPPGDAMSFTPSIAQPIEAAQPGQLGGATVCPGRTVLETPLRQARVVRHLQKMGFNPDVCQDNSPTDRWDMTVVKYLTNGTDASDWVDIEFPDGTFLVVPRYAWSSYRSMRESQGAAEFGRPDRWRIDRSGRSELHVGGTPMVAGVRWWLPHSFVVPPFLETWLNNRDSLGDPMADATVLNLTLERGRLWRSDAKIVLTKPLVDDSRAALPPDDELRNSVLGQDAGPSWFVDASLQRWWIPNDEVLKCLSSERPVYRNRPAAQVATLTLAGIASCGFISLHQ